MKESDKLKQELAEIDRLTEINRTQPEQVRRIQELEGQFDQVLTHRARWHKELTETECFTEQLRKTLRALPDEATGRDLSFERIEVFRHGVTEAAAVALHAFDSQTVVLREFADTSKDRIKTAEGRVARARAFLDEADALARSIAGQINAAKRDLRTLLNGVQPASHDPHSQAEVRWLRAETVVPAFN